MLDTQIGFITTETSEERKQQAMAAGAKFFVQKPFDYQTLHEAVSPVLQNITSENTHDRPTPATPAPAPAEHKAQPPEPPKHPISLPNAENLKRSVQAHCKGDILLEATEPMLLKEHQFPCLMGLFEHPDDKTVSAVILIDLYAANIIGASLSGISADKVKELIKQSSIPKVVLSNCKKILDEIAQNNLHDKATNKPLRLRAINIIRSNIASIQKLLNKSAEERIDVEVAVNSYGSGKITIITQ